MTIRSRASLAIDGRAVRAMKHFRFGVCAVCLVLSVLMLMTACGGRLTPIVAEQNDLFRNTRTGSTYQVLPASYEPVSRGEEYGRLDMDGVSFVLHEIPGLAPEEWLCSVYGDVYCNSSYEIALFEDWDIDVLHVCTNTNLVVDTLTVKASTYPAEQCEALFDLLQGDYKNGTPTDYPTWAEVARVYTLRFETAALSGLYYSVKMIEYTEDIVSDAGNLGRTFLYDRYADRCVPVSNVVFRMLDGERLSDILGEGAAS